MREVLCKSSGLEFVCIHVYKFFVTKHDIKRYNGSRQFYTVKSIPTKQYSNKIQLALKEECKLNINICSYFHIETFEFE